MEDDTTVGDSEELKEFGEGFPDVGVGTDIADGAEALQGGDYQALGGVVETKGKGLDAAGVDYSLRRTRPRLGTVRQRLQRAARRI